MNTAGNQSFHPPEKKHLLHLGIIPDGGRRWAERNRRSLRESYALSRKKIFEWIENSGKWGIGEMSVYLSSAQNYRRNQHEIEAFTGEILHAALHEIHTLAESHQLQLTIAGNVQKLDIELEKLLIPWQEKTNYNQGLCLNLCLNYNPWDEIRQAIVRAGKDQTLENHLWVKNPIDLIVRTGDANLLSNFLPLQSGFARLYFFEKLFNDLTTQEVEECIDHYLSQELKYGT